MIRRHETTILLGEGADARPVTLREITPGQALLFHRAALGGAERAAALQSAADVADLLVGDADAKLQLLAACASLGDEVYELGAAAFMRLWRAFEEVNAPFLDELALRLQSGSQGLPLHNITHGPTHGPNPAGSTSPDSARP